MRLTRVRTRDFLALDRLDLQLTGGRTVITGQNNVGKSTVLAAVSLALDAVAASAGGDARRLDPAWSRAGHRGAQRFEMRLGVEFADAEERLLFDQFLLGAWVSLLYPRGRELAIAEAVSGALEEHPAEMMTAGELLVSFDSTARDRWAVAWEFGPPEARAHVRLLGPQSDYVCPGAAAHRPATTRAQGALAASTNDLLDRLQAGSVPLSLKAVLEQGSYSFEVDVAEMDQLPAEVRAVAEEVDAAGKNLGSIRLGHLLDSLLAREVVVTPNHRSAPRAEFTPAELHTASRRRDGSMLASELHRLKNGRAEERAVFARVQALFQRLTGQRVDCVVENLSPDLQDIDGPRFRVTVVLSRERLGGTGPVSKPVNGFGAGTAGASYDVPLQRSGAGDTEALYLAHLLAQRQSVLLLDEPAVHLSPTAQRRLHALLREMQDTRQIVLVTHSPDMVPASDARDLGAIVRLSRGPDGVAVRRLGDQLAGDRTAITLMTTSAIRSVLFAAAVVLVEGGTDLGLVSGWAAGRLVHDGHELSTLDEANILLLSVDGANNFPAHVGLLTALQVPFAILADGPALNPTSRVARGLSERGFPVPTHGESLDDVREAWEGAGVFTLADDFGDDGSKRGEIEAFLDKVSAATHRQVRELTGARKGVVVGSVFAARVPAPEPFSNLWARLLEHLSTSAETLPRPRL